MNTIKKITEKNISNLLIQKYSDKFVCIPQCKIGSSWTMDNCSIFDMWCMAKSWTKPRVIGFEIKINRNDFLNDQKWQKYLNYCTEFYFVSPPGVIDPAEVPESTGLMITSKNLRMLYTKKKAPVRDVKIPNSIFRYILMWRAIITNERAKDRTIDNTQYWQNWVLEKDEKKKLGCVVSKKIKETIENKILSVESENKKLTAENENLKYIKEKLSSYGIDYIPSRYGADRIINNVINEINIGISGDFLESIKNSIAMLSKTQVILEERLTKTENT